jgi:phosphoglucomutase
MRGIMARLRREGPTVIAGVRVEKIRDVQESVMFDPAKPSVRTPVALPKSNVLQFFLEGGTIVSARPSGTEPKIKFYVNCVAPVVGGGLAAAQARARALCGGISADIRGMLAG